MSAQAIQTPDRQALARTLAAIGRLGLNDNLIDWTRRGTRSFGTCCPPTRWTAPKPRS